MNTKDGSGESVSRGNEQQWKVENPDVTILGHKGYAEAYGFKNPWGPDLVLDVHVWTVITDLDVPIQLIIKTTVSFSAASGRR
jgi:hypothetical protein